MIEVQWISISFWIIIVIIHNKFLFIIYFWMVVIIHYILDTILYGIFIKIINKQSHHVIIDIYLYIEFYTYIISKIFYNILEMNKNPKLKFKISSLLFSAFFKIIARLAMKCTTSKNYFNILRFIRRLVM